MTIRVTLQTIQVLSCFNNSAKLYGAYITTQTKLKSGVIAPILARLTEEKMLSKKWEKGSPTALKRPLKAFYSLTENGQKFKDRLFEELDTLIHK